MVSPPYPEHLNPSIFDPGDRVVENGKVEAKVLSIEPRMLYVEDGKTSERRLVSPMKVCLWVPARWKAKDTVRHYSFGVHVIPENPQPFSYGGVELGQYRISLGPERFSGWTLLDRPGVILWRGLSCTECRGKGFVELFTSKTSCSHGCKPL